MAAYLATQMNERDMETVGQRLQRLQDEAGRRSGKRISNREISRALGISPATWGDWLKEEIELADRQHYIDIAKLFSDTYGIPTKWQWIRDGEIAATNEPLDYDLIYRIICMGRERCEDRGKRLDELATAHLIALVYSNALANGEVSRAYINAQVDALARDN